METIIIILITLMITSLIVFYYNIKKAPIIEKSSNPITSNTVRIVIFKISNASKFDSKYSNLYYEYTNLYIDDDKPTIPQCSNDKFSLENGDLILKNGVYYKYFDTEAISSRLVPVNIVYSGKYIKPLTIIDNLPILK